MANGLKAYLERSAHKLLPSTSDDLFGAADDMVDDLGLISRIECSLCKDGLGKIDEYISSEESISALVSFSIEVCGKFIYPDACRGMISKLFPLMV